MSTRVAAIDCGTNSIRLLISDVFEIPGGSSGGAIEKTDLRREMRIVRLGQDVDRTGRLAPEAIERTLAACREYQGFMAELEVENIVFAATSATRDAANAQEFSDAVFEVLGIRPKVLTGEQEAAASFRGAASEFAADITMVIDIGGGSTEFVQGDASSASTAELVPNFAQSINLGCVRMTERFLTSDPPTTAEREACVFTINEMIAPVLQGIPATDTLILVAGTATTIAAHALTLDHYDSDAIHGSQFSFTKLQNAARELLNMSVDQRRKLGFMHPGRADVIGGGALIVDQILAHLASSTQQVIVSEHDILDGLALSAVDAN